MTDQNDARPVGRTAAAAYRYAEQMTPPAPDRASDVAQETFQHVFEVDPRLMDTHVLQQVFPNWDTLRIMRSRHDHLDWMHAHFARKVVAGSQLLAEISAEGGGSAEETPDG